ncbi:hypothetical protein FS842_005385 [Serendipita sp. 407]|nr:hypothetical protein FS842_005385 [Serendipita sp. 407]
MITISELPEELLEAILSQAISHAFSPRKDASLFEHIDVFSSPCKIHWYTVIIRTSLRLVCRRWNRILGNPKFGVLFLDTAREDGRTIQIDHFAHRAQIIFGWSRHCRGSLCFIDGFRGVEHCSRGIRDKRRQTREGQFLRGPNKLQVLRLPDNNWDPSSFLRTNVGLEALSIMIETLPRVIDATNVANSLTHLLLRAITDNQIIFTIYLPRLVYLRLRMFLFETIGDTEHVFPLDLQMPAITNLYLEGLVGRPYLGSLETMFFQSKGTLVSLLISYNGLSAFPLERLDQFPRLSMFGIAIKSNPGFVAEPLPGNFALHPLPSSSSLSLVLLGLNDSAGRDPTTGYDAYWRRCLDILSRPGKWFTKVIMPFKWQDWDHLWNSSKNPFEGLKNMEAQGPPSCWPCLKYLDNHHILIQDRNGVNLHEGEGKAFLQYMETYTNDD